MNKRKKLLIICPHPVNVAPGQRLKYEQYFSHFEEAGYCLTISNFMTMQFWNIVYKKGFFLQKVLWTLFGYLRRTIDLFRIPFFDGVYIFLWVTPFGMPVFEALTCLLAKKVIYDIDDMVFLGHSSDANRFWQSLKGRKKMIYLMKKSNHVITCTPALDEFVRKYNCNTTDISSTINTDTYIPKNEYTNDKQIVIGWSGSHSTSKYLYLLREVFLELSKKYDFKLFVIGDKDFHIEGINVEAIDWNEQDEVRNLQKIDIGVYPLPDEPWVYGKSGLKALQYMALGIPTVASAVGTIHRIINSKENGILVKSDEEWINELSQLIDNPNLRAKLGQKAIETVENDYSIKSNKSIYINILSSTLG